MLMPSETEFVKVLQKHDVVLTEMSCDAIIASLVVGSKVYSEKDLDRARSFATRCGFVFLFVYACMHVCTYVYALKLTSLPLSMQHPTWI